MSSDVDVVIIGSGAGGLSAAVALARAGLRVLVLEQHYLPGGFCHSFTLGGFRWSPGVHYLGELGPGGMARRIYEGLGLGGDLRFFELNPSGYDHVQLGNERYSICSGREALIERLSSYFPHEKEGIRRYVDTASRIGGDLRQLLELDGIFGVLGLPLRAPTLTRWFMHSSKSLIDACVSDPKLAAILGAQSGDHGMPPSQAPAALHAAVFGHYADGGFYPAGGAGSLPRAFLRALRRAGGSIRVRERVTRILVEHGRAIGVRLESGEEIRARAVISNADPSVTFGQLLPSQDVPSRTARRLAKTRYSTSALSLFMAVDVDPRSYGLDSGNVWYFAHHDIDRIYREQLTPWGSEVRQLPFLFLSATTLKDPSRTYGTRHTIEAFTLIHYDAFRLWTDSDTSARPESYEIRKKELIRLMLDAATRIAPGLTDHVVYADLGTPLTNEFYCGSTMGSMYGTEKSLRQVGPFAWQIRTSIESLYLVGASTLGHGVMVATISGLTAARMLLGCGFDELLKSGGPPLEVLQAHAALRSPALVPDGAVR
jgi:phytoene dehydrogenase-like protein